MPTSDIVGHFEDLTKAHEAVRRAQAQLDALTPLLTDCDAHDKVRRGHRDAGRPAGRAEVLLRRSARPGCSTSCSPSLVRAGPSTRARLKRARRRRWAACASRRRACKSSGPATAATGSAEIERQHRRDGKARDARHEKAERFGELLAGAGLDPVETAEQFAVAAPRDRRPRRGGQRDRRGLRRTGSPRQRSRRSELDAQAGEVNAELRSLRARKNNIPKRSLDLRRWLCR